MSQYCVNDYVKLFDGRNTRQPVLGIYCGSSRPGRIRTSGNDLYLHFHSNGVKFGRGFRISWRAVDKIITTPEVTTVSTQSYPKSKIWFGFLSYNGTFTVSRFNMIFGYPSKYCLILFRTEIWKDVSVLSQNFRVQEFWISVEEFIFIISWAFLDKRVSDWILRMRHVSRCLKQFCIYFA